MNRKVRLVALLFVSLLPFGKAFLYRTLFSAKIGKRVKLGFGAVLVFDTLELGDDCRISSLCIIRGRRIVIGPRSTVGVFTRINLHTMELGSSVTIGPQVSILAEFDDERCVFVAGAESWVFEYCYLNPARPIRFGRNVGVGGGSYIFTHGLWLSALKGYPVSYGEVTLGNDVWLPWGCFIMPGVQIGDGAIVGARSLVTKNVPALALVAGTPAKVIREIVAQETTHSEQIVLLTDATKEFCSLKKVSCVTDDHRDYLLFAINGVPSLAIAKRANADAPPAQYQEALRVVPEYFKHADHRGGPVFSLESFQCSSRGRLNSTQAAWLQHLRRIGTRHYPIDEVVVET